jgi:hypothetical protein
MLRYEAELSYLRSHQGSIDRVLHSDGLDVFFQGDPFAGHVSEPLLTFVVEPHCIRPCGWNFGWILKCYGERSAYELAHRFIVCCGSIGGPADEYAKLIGLMIAQAQWHTCWAASMYQPVLNWLLWTRRIHAAGIQYQLTGCDNGFLTMQWCVTEANVLRNEHEQVVSATGSVPSYLHPYNRSAPFARHLFSTCDLWKWIACRPKCETLLDSGSRKLALVGEALRNVAASTFRPTNHSAGTPRRRSPRSESCAVNLPTLAEATGRQSIDGRRQPHRRCAVIF